MIIEGTRFGTIEVNEDRMITMPAGMIGFASETRFVLLEPNAGRTTGWLQSVDNPELAFPVIDANALSPNYPPTTLRDSARNAGVADDDLAAIGFFFPRDHFHQRGFPGAVSANHSDDSARRNFERKIFEKQLIAEGFRDILGFDDLSPEARPRWNIDFDFVDLLTAVFVHHFFVSVHAGF